ncbi:MAG: hypothetical protein K2H86_06210 [Muribaculaceae bacterium]|nr:hypothetical protein [Muribaculaceae bacterium]
MSKAWSIWWHPRRTSRELSALEEELCVQTQSLADCQRELALVKAGCRQLEEQVSQGQATERTLREELEDYKAESLSWRQIEKEMEEVYARLESVDELKRGYERKIARLRLRLRDSGGDASSVDEDENSELIDMRRGAVCDGASAVRGGEKRVSSGDDNSEREDDDSDWLRILPREI